MLFFSSWNKLLDLCCLNNFGLTQVGDNSSTTFGVLVVISFGLVNLTLEVCCLSNGGVDLEFDENWGKGPALRE